MRAAEKEPIYLLDVSFFTFRAYHALPELNTSTGLPTNAVHGVSTMLERLLRERKPRFVGGCFDCEAPTFRSALFADYKANRKVPDEALKRQFPLVRRLLAGMGIHCLECPGFEADDILATLARRFDQAGLEVVLVTGDKDLMQCVTDRVSLADPIRELEIRRPQVFEKFGVVPEAVPDVLGLMGDSSDNIPGVRGIGPKTASALIAHFGSLDAMLARTEEIERISIRGAASVRKKIEEGAEIARMSRRLATVVYDAPVDVAPEALRLTRLVTPELQALAAELEMSRLVGRLQALARESGLEVEAAADDATVPAPELPAAPAAAALPGAEFPWDDWSRVVGPGPVAIVLGRTAPPLPLGERDEGMIVAASRDSLRGLAVGATAVTGCLAALASAGASLVGYDLKEVCRELGGSLGRDGLDLGVASYLVDASAGDHGRRDLCQRLLGEEAVDLPLSADLAVLAGPAGQALGQVRRLAERLRRELGERSQSELYRTLEHPLISVLAAMERRGMLLETRVLLEMSKDLRARMDGMVGRIYEAAGHEFNILSPVQLREILFNELRLPATGIKNTQSGPSTDSESLEALAPLHPLPALVLEYRGMAKLKSTYLDALPRMVDSEGRIHTRLNQTVAATGRLSSKDPNLQNIPIRTEDGARIRTAFCAPEGKLLVSADYNQIELRVLAHLSGDEALIEAFRTGQDVHRATAAELFGVAPEGVTGAMRRAAKVVNFGVVYGMGPVRLSRELGIGRAEATDFIRRYFARYPGVRRFFDRTLEEARSKGYVSTLMGRRRYVPDLISDHGGQRQMAERMATNTPIQGSAADIIKLAMVRLAEALGRAGWGAELVLQIHDELLVECPKDESDRASKLMVEVMEGAADLLVPLVVDVGSGANWAEAH